MPVAQFEKSDPGSSTVGQQFSALLTQHQHKLVALAYRMLGNFEDARDSVQDVFVKLWKTTAWQQDDIEVLPWLIRSLINHCIDKLRRRKIRQFFSFDEWRGEAKAATIGRPDREADRVEMQQMLQSSIARLKPKQKAIFILRDVHGYSVSETANLLDCSENNVLTNLHLARKNLRKWLKPYLKN